MAGSRGGRSRGVRARERAYVDLLMWSQTFAFRVSTLITTVENRSGVAEGIAVTLRQRAPMDPMTLQDWMDVDLRPLMDAWSRAWACASPRGVELSNAVLDACVQLAAVLSAGPKLTGSAKLRVALLGAKVDEQRALYNERMPVLAAARKDLTELIRAETGRPPAQLSHTSTSQSARDDEA